MFFRFLDWFLNGCLSVVMLAMLMLILFLLDEKDIKQVLWAILDGILGKGRMCSFTECSFTSLFTGAKLFHIVTFLMLSFLVCRKLASWSRLSDPWAVVLGIVLVGSFGFLTEYLQGATDSRTGTACDVVINFCATAVGAVMACLYLRRRFTEG